MFNFLQDTKPQVQDLFRAMPQHTMGSAIYPGFPMPMYGAATPTMAPMLPLPHMNGIKPELPSPNDMPQSNFVQQLQSKSLNSDKRNDGIAKVAK